MFFSKKTIPGGKWMSFNEDTEIQKVFTQSNKGAVFIFKHSTRCSISRVVLGRLNDGLDWSLNCHFYYLDLLSFRSLSSDIENLSKVKHESPQAILIHKEKVIYHNSHNGIVSDQINQIIKAIE